jgi:hypothetical protein
MDKPGSSVVLPVWCSSVKAADFSSRRLSTAKAMAASGLEVGSAVASGIGIGVGEVPQPTKKDSNAIAAMRLAKLGRFLIKVRY